MPIRTLLIACLLFALPALAQRIAPVPQRINPTTPAPERKADPTTPRRPASQPAVPKFVIGVFQQPTSSFDAWKGRGINTVVSYESQGGKVSNDEWSEAAAAKGFYFIRQPSDDLEADAKEPNLLALMHDDEPDIRKPPTPADVLARRYADWKKAAPDKPVFLNVSGGQMLGGKTPKTVYDAYFP